MANKLYNTVLTTLLFLIGVSFVSAQPTTVEFDKMVHDFGDIMLNSGHHSCTFTFKNISKQPIVIQTVIASCGCTTPVWTKSPVPPGGTGKIDVTFLNDQGPFPFDKSFTVYITGESRPVTLRIRGVAHDKPKTLRELFPENFGSVSFRRSFIDFGNIAQGDTRKESVEVANTSNSTITISFRNLTPGLSLEATPSRIAPGGRAQVSITLDTKAQVNWGKTDYYATVAVNGTPVTAKQLRITANIRDNFTSLTKEQTENAPLPMASTSSYDFGSIKSGTQVRASFTIRNLGRTPLLIHKVDTGDKRVSVRSPGRIEPGTSANLDVTIDTKEDSGDKGYILSLITNSPSRPVLNLLITGKIIK